MQVDCATHLCPDIMKSMENLEDGSLLLCWLLSQAIGIGAHDYI